MNSHWYKDKLFVNYLLKTFKKWRGMKPMVLSESWADSLEIIALHPVKNLPGINSMSLRAPRDYSLDMINLQKVKKIYGD